MIRSRAAVAWAAGQPLDVTEIDVAPPQAGEVLLRMVATGVCHTDAYNAQGPIRRAYFLPFLDTKVALKWWRLEKV